MRLKYQIIILIPLMLSIITALIAGCWTDRYVVAWFCTSIMFIIATIGVVVNLVSISIKNSNDFFIKQIATINRNMGILSDNICVIRSNIDSIQYPINMPNIQNTIDKKADNI
jgi:hypothetical protein